MPCDQDIGPSAFAIFAIHTCLHAGPALTSLALDKNVFCTYGIELNEKCEKPCTCVPRIERHVNGQHGPLFIFYDDQSHVLPVLPFRTNSQPSLAWHRITITGQILCYGFMYYVQMFSTTKKDPTPSVIKTTWG